MKQPLLIQIQNPCHESWDSMTQNEQGKFCSNCQKTVIDFSTKTDAELIEYFKKHNSFCGRFKQTQINRILEEPKPVLKKLFNFYSKAAALFFTVFSFKSFQANAQTTQPKIENFVQHADEIHQEKIKIEGTITDDENRFVDSVTVFFDNIKVASSNHLGHYQFEIENITLKNHVISFDKNKYRSTAISFHPLMVNTKYDIFMCNYQGKECVDNHYYMGIPSVPHFEQKMILTSTFKSNKELIFMLNDLAVWMRTNPNSPISLNFYFLKDSQKKIFEKKGQEIIHYLVNNQGIDRERLNMKFLKNVQKANSIEVVNFRDE
jgi:hypothetical protein